MLVQGFGGQSQDQRSKSTGPQEKARSKLSQAATQNTDASCGSKEKGPKGGSL